MSMNFPLRTAFAASIDFEWFCFHYHLFQSIFLISLLISLLTHWFFCRMLFSCHVVISFSHFFSCGDYYYYYYYHYYFAFQGCTHGRRFQGQGSNWSCSCWPAPQPKQLRILAISATYATVHSNAKSLTSQARPEI